MANGGLSGAGFMWRWLLCLALVMVTFNPSGVSYYAWIIGGGGSLPLKVLSGIILVAAYAFVLHATWESLGPFGVGLSVAFFAAVIWALVDFGLLSLNSFSVVAWIALFALATILAVGMSFSIVRRKVTGQVDVDDVDD